MDELLLRAVPTARKQKRALRGVELGGTLAYFTYARFGIPGQPIFVGDMPSTNDGGFGECVD